MKCFFKVLIKTSEVSLEKKKYSILRRICLQILNAKLDSNVTIATEKGNYSSITTSDSINSV